MIVGFEVAKSQTKNKYKTEIISDVISIRVTPFWTRSGFEWQHLPHRSPHALKKEVETINLFCWFPFQNSKAAQKSLPSTIPHLSSTRSWEQFAFNSH